MQGRDRKEIILDLREWDEEVFREGLARGIVSYYCDPKNVPPSVRKGLTTYSDSSDGDVQVLRDLPASAKAEGFALYVEVLAPKDIDRLLSAPRLGAKVLFVEAKDWKIIPLENLIAELRGASVKLIAKADRVDEVEIMYGILEKGVDGVLIRPKGKEDVKTLVELLSHIRRVQLSTAEVTEVRDVGLGDRACIDTVSILGIGDGMLVGSRAGFLFLIHNESIGSAFTEPRPFRVNAGAIHSYTLMPDGRTKYLSELRSGDRVLIVNSSGYVRPVAVGRVKIERRPLRIVMARVNDEYGTVIVQNAETIRFVGENNRLIPSTDIKPGDRVLVYTTKESARHFGRAVDEFIIER